MRACFISHSAFMWGAEKALLELIAALESRDVKCHVLLPRDGTLARELSTRQIPFSIIPFKFWIGLATPLWKLIMRPLWHVLMAIVVAVQVRRWRCDIVCTNTIAVCTGALAAKLARLPHVWLIQEFGYEDHGALFDMGRTFSLWFMDRFSIAFIANSHAVAKHYMQWLPPSKISAVYFPGIVSTSSSVENSVLPKRDDAGLRCVLVGQLAKGKGQHDAIHAVAELVKTGIRVNLYFAGEGDDVNYRRHLRDLIVANNLNDCVHFLGYVNNPASLMRAADVVLMCSRQEAFGMVTVEAMYAAKPIVGAKSGATPELVRHGFNGLLYEPGDHKGLAEGIRYLHDHPDIAQQMGANGRKWALENFTEQAIAEGVLAVLRKSLNQR